MCGVCSFTWRSSPGAVGCWVIGCIVCNGRAKMSVSYDPDEIPNLDQAIVDEADAMGMQIVHVICDEPSAKVGDVGGVAFFAIVPAMPRTGERIELQDRTVCIVRDIIWRVVK